jgi:hypothetical protein
VLGILTDAASIPPKVPEPVRHQRRVDGSAGNRPMAEPSLNSPGVVPLVGEGVAAGVPQHVRVGLELQASASGGRPALADEDKGRIYLPSVERLAHLIAKRNPPDSIGAERNLLSQTQTHAVRLGTSAASELIPRLSKHRLIRVAPTLAELGLDGMKLIKKLLFCNKFHDNSWRSIDEPDAKSGQFASAIRQVTRQRRSRSASLRP